MTALQHCEYTERAPFKQYYKSYFCGQACQVPCWEHEQEQRMMLNGWKALQQTAPWQRPGIRVTDGSNSCQAVMVGKSLTPLRASFLLWEGEQVGTASAFMTRCPCQLRLQIHFVHFMDLHILSKDLLLDAFRCCLKTYPSNHF